MEQARADGPVAEEARDDLPRLPHLRGERGTARDGKRAADDAVRAEVARLHVRQVQTSAAAAADARRPSEYLRQEALRVAAFRESVPVSAVRARDVVIAGERAADAGGHGFLADVKVRSTFDDACIQELEHLLFE